MKKEEIRKEFFKLRIKGHSYTQCRKILLASFNYEVNIRTLKRWTSRLNTNQWDLMDSSRRPKKIQTKITLDIENKIISLREKTGWGSEKINSVINEVSISTIKRILLRNNLSKSNPNKKKRIKYIRWQRKHPNSLWQSDTSDQKVKDKYVLSVIDDCSRYCLTMKPLNELSTKIITGVFDELIKIHGKPREILTDNGSVYGSKSKHSQFDRWCNRKGIKHIRSAIHSPTTTGKVERLFQTMINEMPFCNNDPELFRMRYNHFRPHTSLENKSPSDIYFDFSKLF
jgi:putative transposase